jgi:hypothetical protein
MRRNDVRLRIIREAVEGLIPGSTPAFLNVQLTETLPLARGASVHTWTGTPAGLAERVYTALYGRPGIPATASPLAQSDAAHARRDAAGVVDSLTGAEQKLTGADWYPVRPGDLVHVHYEAGGETPAFGETYVIGHVGAGLMSMQLLAHTLPESAGAPEEIGVGFFAADAADDPLYTAWFEAGPQRLTIVRDGRVVHNGGAK